MAYNIVRRMVLVLCLAGFFIAPVTVQAQVCNGGDIIILTTQAEVDNFMTTIGPCDRVTGGLFIGPSVDIANLDGLSGLVAIDILAIDNAPVTDITGLSTVLSLDGLLIEQTGLAGLTGLSGPSVLIGLNLIDNPLLSNLSALGGLTSVSSLVIAGSGMLTSLDDLSGLETIGSVSITNNPELTSVSGLTGASGIQSIFVQQNPQLVSLDGLQGATSLTGLIVEDNDSLTNLAHLAGLASVGSLNPQMRINDNDNLTSLDGLGSLMSLDADLFLNNNPVLGDCSALSTLLDSVDDGDPGPGPGGAGIPDINGNVTMAFNQPHCNSVDTVLDGPAIDPLDIIPDGPVVLGTIADLEGVASDIGRGDSNVISVEYAVDIGPWTGASPVDGNFDSPTEAFQAFVDTGPLALGEHAVCARAEDAMGHIGQRCVSLEVVDGAVDTEWMVVCTHQPIWPQPGDTIRITMNVNERGEGNEETPPFHPDSLEIWFEDPLEPVFVVNAPGTSFIDYESATLQAGRVTYGCRAVFNGESIFSGWRGVAVGTPAGSGPIPIGVTGAPSQRLDIVFIADDDSYSGSSDVNFLADVRAAIRDSYYLYGYYNRYQHLFNFWISRETGVVDGDASNCSPPGGTDRVVELPTDWNENYAFAEAGAVIHTDCFREFAQDPIFTIEPGERANTPSHELGHRAFGLADEYCCDAGYYERDLFPNIYETLAACEADAPNLDRMAEDCRDWDELEDGMVVDTWYTSEPTPNDLMNGDQSPPQAADKRRIEWWFETCRDNTEGINGC